MTKQNYTNMSNEELLDIIQGINVSNRKLKLYLTRHNYLLNNEIISRTHFLDDYYEANKVPILARLYCLKHNLSEQPKCKNPKCKNHNPPVKWMNGQNKFREYCCLECANTDPIHQQKMQETMLKNYGVRHALQTQMFLEKCRSTCRKNNGVDFPSQSYEVRRKIKETNLNNLGVDNPLKSEQVKQKMRKTNNRIYGVDYVLQSNEIKTKIKNTLNCLYGVDNFSQTNEFHKKCHKRYTSQKYPNMTFTNAWEFRVYDFLTEHNIMFEYQVDPIPYEYDGKIHYYIPDFRVNGKIFEVKGDYFFRKNETTGREEMYQPYRNPNESDEHYNWACGKEEAKHQCMIAHNVIILRKAQIENLDSVFQVD